MKTGEKLRYKYVLTIQPILASLARNAFFIVLPGAYREVVNFI